MKVHYIKNCGEIKNRVITVHENSTITLTNDCEVIPNSCAETTGFKTALVTYQAWRNNLPILRNEVDGCELVTKMNEDIRSMFKLFGLPDKCPVEKV